MPEIEITINEDGTVLIDGQGFNGIGCEQALAEYIKAVGQAKNTTKKAEFYNKQQKIGQTNAQGQCGA